jgi:hypothetical protein
MKDLHLAEEDVLALVHRRPVSQEAEEHSIRCSECAQRVAGQKEVWRAMATGLPAPDPEKMWEEIEPHLNAQVPLRRPVTRQPWALAAVLLLSLGIGASWQLYSLGSRIAALEQANIELALEHSSAAWRLAAVAGLSKNPGDQGAIEALLSLLESDPDQHVRLSALEALRDPLEAGAISTGVLVEILASEPSPLVQTDLIVSILQAGGPGMLQAIRDTLPRDSIHPFVAAQLFEI